MTRVHRVVLVRPWLDAHGGGGCCSGDTRSSIGLDRPVTAPVEHDHATRVVGRSYERLRTALPEVDVQIVSSSNTVYLLPRALRAARRGDGVRAALRRANAATRPGALLVDGEFVGDVEELGPDGVVAAVRERIGHHARG